MGLLEKTLKAMEESEEIPVKEKNSLIEKSKAPKKRIGISDRGMNKEQTLNAIYKLGKESIDNITDVKLRSILEDIKVYSKRK